MRLLLIKKKKKERIESNEFIRKPSHTKNQRQQKMDHIRPKQSTYKLYKT